MKSIKYNSGLIIILLFLSACSNDFLDREPIDFKTTAAITTSESILEALNGAYNSIIYRNGMHLQPIGTDFATDIGYCNDPVAELILWKSIQTPDDESCIREKWIRNYEGILRANTVIHYAQSVLENFPAEKSKIDRYVAEAKVIRAYFYSDLIDYYGAVPLRLEPEGLESAVSPRVPVNDIVEQICIDLQDAASILPTSYNGADYGRMTKGAAYAIEGRIYLFNGNFENAITAYRNVINLNVYQLYSSYTNLFTIAAEKTNKEYIMTQQYMTGKVTEKLSGAFWSAYSAMGAYHISNELVKEYYMLNGLNIEDTGSGYNKYKPWLNRDPRLGAVVKMDSVSLSTYVDNTTNNYTGFRLKKFIDDDFNSGKVHQNDEIDFPLIRYAEVILGLAEALVETGTYNYNEVTSLVDEIRDRAGMPLVSEVEGAAGQLSQSALKELIRHERMVELAYEGLRTSDIRRWGIGPSVIGDIHCFTKKTDGNGGIYYETKLFESRTFDSSKGYLWPIPAIELQTNQVDQNLGY